MKRLPPTPLLVLAEGRLEKTAAVKLLDIIDPNETAIATATTSTSTKERYSRACTGKPPSYL